MKTRDTADPSKGPRPLSMAAKHRRIAELLADINLGLDQLSRGNEAIRNKLS